MKMILRFSLLIPLLFCIPAGLFAGPIPEGGGSNTPGTTYKPGGIAGGLAVSLTDLALTSVRPDGSSIRVQVAGGQSVFHLRGGSFFEEGILAVRDGSAASPVVAGGVHLGAAVAVDIGPGSILLFDETGYIVGESGARFTLQPGARIVKFKFSDYPSLDDKIGAIENILANTSPESDAGALINLNMGGSAPGTPLAVGRYAVAASSAGTYRRGASGWIRE
jgi:hypothetical protein